MDNPNPSRISSTVITLLYFEVLLRWERGLSEEGFNIRSKGFNSYRKSHPINLISIDDLPEIKITFDNHQPILKHKEQNIFIFYNCYSSQAKSLYFHIRNAIAHGHIERIKIGRSDYYYFEGLKQSASQKERMKGQIKATMLKDFITALQLTVKESPDVSG